MYFRGVSVSNKAKEGCETISTSIYYLNWIARCRKEEEEYKKRVQKRAKLKVNKVNPNTNNFSKQENIPQKMITVKPGCIYSYRKEKTDLLKYFFTQGCCIFYGIYDSFTKNSISIPFNGDVFYLDISVIDIKPNLLKNVLCIVELSPNTCEFINKKLK